MSKDILSPEEMSRWRSFRYMVEETSLRVSREVASATGTSGGQFGILWILNETASCEMRQQELADEMRWDRTRLSHQITRMAKRGLIKRNKKSDGATTIVITKLGRIELEHIAPILASAVRTHFFRRLTVGQLAKLAELEAVLHD